MKDKPSEESLQLAAQCWCDEETSSIVMDTRLAVAFAKRLDNLKLEIEFIKQWFNPKDTSFRDMMITFKSLDEDKKDKLIDLARSLARLAESGQK